MNKKNEAKVTTGEKFTFYEFFAGGGMARAGLGTGWQCLFANDFDHKKVEAYRRNWSAGENGVMVHGDVAKLSIDAMPNHPDLVWASFPCQDLSLAGGGAGLKGDRSGTFWPFWSHMRALRQAGRAPRMIVLENVCGTLTSHQGKDFTGLCQALAEGGYRYGALVIDAAHFVPQSRPRLFIVALRKDIEVPVELIGEVPVNKWHSGPLQRAYEQLPAELKADWAWWSVPVPGKRKKRFLDLIEKNPSDVAWHNQAETAKLIDMMSDVNRAKLAKVQASGKAAVGAVYKRTRYVGGEKVQRAEVRFDDLSGCLRTPAGGSSRQLIMLVDGPLVRSRLISARETARLMGLKEEYVLPENYTEAYHLTGDGVVVNVVRHIAKYLLEPALQKSREGVLEAA